MLAYLCVINNRADELRLQRIINNPPRGIGGKTLEMAAAAGGRGRRAAVRRSSPTRDSYPEPGKGGCEAHGLHGHDRGMRGAAADAAAAGFL